ncbi:MAG: DMT family transporter [Pseudomonadota bacterium]
MLSRETRLALIPFLFVWLWSTGFVGAKLGTPYMDPLLLLSIRFVLVIAIFAGLIAILRAAPAKRRDIPMQILIGALLHGFYLGGVFVAVRHGTPAGISAIFVGLQPILTVAINAVLFDVRISQRQALGLSLGFGGLVAVILGSQEMTSADLGPFGVAACTVSLLAITAATLLQKHYAKDTPLLGGSLWQYFGGLLVAGFGTAFFETGQIDYTWQIYVAIGWLVLALSVCAVLLLLYMIREGALEKVSAYMYLVPPVAAIQTWALFGEELSALSILGCIVVVIGVALVVRPKIKAHK